MIAAVDIGGTKTLVAACRNDGSVSARQKFPTPKDYEAFVEELSKTIKIICPDRLDIISIGCAGTIDRRTGAVINSPNLGWQNRPLIRDLKHIFSGTPIIIENDANLAGLSEAHSLDKPTRRVLYITISTGIGTGFIADGRLEPNLLDSEGGRMVFEHDDRLINWESFAAGLDYRRRLR